MQKEKDQIKEEIKNLIAKSNAVLRASQNRQRVVAYLYIIFSLFALSFFGFFAIRPTLTTISDLNKKLDEEKLTLKQLKEKNAALKSLSAQYIDIEPDLGLVDNAIPQSPQIAQLVRQIEVLTKQFNLTVKKIDTGLMELYPARNATSSIYSFIFSVSVSGNEKDVNAFIGEVINMGRMVGIERLSTGKKLDNVYSSTITGRAFFHKE